MTNDNAPEASTPAQLRSGPSQEGAAGSDATLKGRGWIATHTNGKVLHLSELDGWTVEQVVG